MNLITLRHRARQLWPDRLPHARHNRQAWLRSVARLGSRWLLANQVGRAA